MRSHNQSVIDVKRKREVSPPKKQRNKKRKLDKLIGWGEKSSQWVEPDQSDKQSSLQVEKGKNNVNLEDGIAQGVPRAGSSRLEEYEQQASQTCLQEENGNRIKTLMELEVQNSVKVDTDKMKQTNILDRKVIVDYKESEVPSGKTVSYKRRTKLSQTEMKRIKLTHSNIFNWLTPSILPNTAKITEQEKMTSNILEGEVPMEVVDRDRELRLDRVRARQSQLMTKQVCKEMMLDMVENAVKTVGTRLCKRVVMEDVVTTAWNEFNYIMEMVDQGDVELRSKIEKRLVEDRELIAAEAEMIKQIKLEKIKKNKENALRILWKKRKLEIDLQRMTEAMAQLEVNDWYKEVEQLMDMLDNIVLTPPTISMEDVTMSEKEGDSHHHEIVWEKGMMDTEMEEDEMDKATEMDMGTDPVSKMEESMMVEVSLGIEEPHHHGGLSPSVRTLLTTPENGMEVMVVLDEQDTGDLLSGARTPNNVKETDRPTMHNLG